MSFPLAYSLTRFCCKVLRLLCQNVSLPRISFFPSIHLHQHLHVLAMLLILFTLLNDGNYRRSNEFLCYVKSGQ